MTPEDKIEWATQVFQSQYGLVVGGARRYVPNSDDVEDIVQQVYVDFLNYVLDEKWEWDGEHHLEALLYRMTKRKAQLLWRKRYQDERLIFNVLAERLARGDDDREDAAEELAIVESKIRALNRCLEKLPPRSRAILEQHYYENVSVKEIAKHQFKRSSAIYQFFSRLRLKLRDCIEKTITTEEGQ